MPTERTEHQRTEHALREVFDYISPGTNEGISFVISRLTDDLFTDSFLGGGDISLFTASGRRGVIRSQQSNGSTLDSAGGAPAQFPLTLELDLNSGEASGSWTLPNGIAQTSSFRLLFVKSAAGPKGNTLMFGSDSTSDDAAYSLTLVLI